MVREIQIERFKVIALPPPHEAFGESGLEMIH